MIPPPTLLQDRLRTSAILVTIVGVLLWLDARYSPPGAEGVFLVPLLLFFSLGTAWDLATMVRASPTSMPKINPDAVGHSPSQDEVVTEVVESITTGQTTSTVTALLATAIITL